MEPFINLNELPKFKPTGYDSQSAFNVLNHTMSNALRKIESLHATINTDYNKKKDEYIKSDESRFLKHQMEHSFQSVKNLQWIQTYSHSLMHHFVRLQAYIDELDKCEINGYWFTVNYTKHQIDLFDRQADMITQLVHSELTNLRGQIEAFKGYKSLPDAIKTTIQGKKITHTSFELLQRNIEEISDKFHEIYDVNKEKITYFNTWYQPSPLILDLKNREVPFFEGEDICSESMSAPIMQALSSDFMPILIFRFNTPHDRTPFVQTFQQLPNNKWATMGPVVDGNMAASNQANPQWTEVTETALYDLYQRLSQEGFVQTYSETETAYEDSQVVYYSLV